MFIGYRTAIDAVDAALAAVKSCRPHGRDYYPQSPGALANAQDEQDERELKLVGIRAELTELALAVQPKK